MTGNPGKFTAQYFQIDDLDLTLARDRFRAPRCHAVKKHRVDIEDVAATKGFNRVYCVFVAQTRTDVST